jgi:hypothetical protein
MNTTERAPLLSDEQSDRIRMENRFFIDSLNGRVALWNRAIEQGRDFYEDLITKGKLIVAGVDRIVVTTGDNGIRCRSVLMGGPIQAWVAIPEDEYERFISEGAIVLKKDG